MNLANEDSLRLSVLFSKKPQALRIDESNMIIYALTSRGEVKISLNPNSKNQIYLRRVREMISNHILSSPASYPIYIKRWTRMGQARAESLKHLLLLGEPEAVVAVVHAEGLTDELAQRAWWCMPNADNARRMLEKPAVAQTNLGKVLANYLVEHLPFETESNTIIDSVYLILRADLINQDTLFQLWNKAAKQVAYYVGFLLACPDALPDRCKENPNRKKLMKLFLQQSRRGNPYVELLNRVWQPHGQIFIKTVASVFQQAKDQETIVRLLQALELYFAKGRFKPLQSNSIQQIQKDCEKRLASDTVNLNPLLQSEAELKPTLAALLLLCNVRKSIVNPIFSRTNAIGTLMRRKLEPITQPILQASLCLLEPN